MPSFCDFDRPDDADGTRSGGVPNSTDIQTASKPAASMLPSLRQRSNTLRPRDTNDHVDRLDVTDISVALVTVSPS